MKNLGIFRNIGIIGATDSYKVSHWKQLPPNTTHIYSFFESRMPEAKEIVFYGLQYYLKEYLAGQAITREGIEFAKLFFQRHFGSDKIFNEEMWLYILKEHKGYLPIEIKALPEGLYLPGGNALMTIVNTDPKLPSLTNYLETMLSMIWYPCTVATRSREMKRIILKYLEKTGNPEGVDFKLHDFGFRGSTSPESSGIGGSAHLLNFKGTDTLSGILLAQETYGEDMAGFSIPAAEHSTITSWGRENERDAYENMLNQFPKGLVAVVSDSYDVFNACEFIWGEQLRVKILERDGVLVVRPDSGYPPEVVLKVLRILGEKFGTYDNRKGYRVLNNHIRVIQGDGIDPAMLEKILVEMERMKWSADNIAFGSGGGLLQKGLDRDTFKFAFKCCAVNKNGEWHDVMKDPVTDPGKKSKAGKLKLILDDGIYRTVREEDSPLPNELKTVFRNGEVIQDYTFAEIRKRAEIVR